MVKSDYDYDEVNHLIYKMREKSQELIRHENTLLHQSFVWGQKKSNFESSLIQKRDRALNATNFQDLGIKHREAVQPPTYGTTKDFLVEGETSDEETVHLDFESKIKLPEVKQSKNKFHNLEINDILC